MHRIAAAAGKDQSETNFGRARRPALNACISPMLLSVVTVGRLLLSVVAFGRARRPAL